MVAIDVYVIVPSTSSLEKFLSTQPHNVYYDERPWAKNRDEPAVYYYIPKT